MVRPSTQPSSRRRAAKAPAHGAKPEALAPRNPIVGSLPVCCADVLMGHVAVALTISVMNSRRLIAAPEALRGHRTDLLFSLEGVDDRGDVRFGSKADMCSARAHVCFTPNSDRKSRHRPLRPMLLSSVTEEYDHARRSDLDLTRTLQSPLE